MPFPIPFSVFAGHSWEALAGKAANYARGYYYARQFERSGWVQAAGRIRVKRRYGDIHVGKVLFWPDVTINIQGRSRERKGVLEVGDFCSIGDRTEFHIAERISLGTHVIIAWDCVLMDHPYHRFNGEPEVVRPVVIGDHVWIACRALILPGVHIGPYAVVAAGSVVTRDVPAHCVVAGNPARIVKRIESWES